jgi:hypothetical protein
MKTGIQPSRHHGNLTALYRILMAVIYLTLIVRRRANDVFPKGHGRREARGFLAYGPPVLKIKKNKAF